MQCSDSESFCKVAVSTGKNPSSLQNPGDVLRFIAMHLTELRINSEKYPTRRLYPFCLDVFNVTRRLEFASPVTFFVGENGTGKSTLLKGIAQKCGIHIWKGLSRTRYENNPHEEALQHYLDIKWDDGEVTGAFYAAEIFRNFAQILDEWASSDPGVLGYFGDKSLMTQSHGQSHMSFFENRFKLKGLYLLDEPENALSPKSQIHLLKVMRDTCRSGHAQFIMATHSPILLAYSGATIYSFDYSPIKSVDYEDTDHFRIYRAFLNQRSGFNERSGYIDSID